MRQAIVLIDFCPSIRLQMGIYATLAVGQALAASLNGAILAFIIYSTSRQMHDVCLSGSLFTLSNSWVERHPPRNAKSDVFL